MKHTKETTRRINVYIDGFNLYHGICDTKHKELLWINLVKLIKMIKEENEIINQIKYFTTVPEKSIVDIGTAHRFSEEDNHEIDKIERHKLWLKLLKNLDHRIKIITGKFQYKNNTCKKCGANYTQRTEKRTDVNITVEALIDAFNNDFDNAYIISADSDLVSVIKAIKRKFVKRVIVVFPPKRYSKVLVNTADKKIQINIPNLKKCKLPDEFQLRSGKYIKKPSNWIYLSS